MSNLTDRLSATLSLDEPVGKIPLVSTSRQKALAALDIVTVRDLATHYPRRYLDLSAVKTIRNARTGESCSIKGQIHRVELKRPKRVDFTEVTLVDGTGTLIIICWKQPWLAKSLTAGMQIAVSGTIEMNGGFKQMTNPFIEPIDDEGFMGRIIPIHPACAAISPAWMRRLVTNALAACEGVYDPLPMSLRTRYRLMSRQNALRSIHFPQSMDEMAQARRRLAFEELFFLQLMVMRESNERERGLTPMVHTVDGPAVGTLIGSLPFTLTEGQRLAIQDIASHMASSHSMNHLLLGDVGTGKTIVAAAACAMAHDSGTQALVLAPTEVLATQHAASMGGVFDTACIPWALLTANTTHAQRTDILARLSAGEISVLIGTHAILEDDVVFKRLTLAVIDEQQRFGVEQREKALAKGEATDALYLTATPIPRTLALALYGNLTLSYLKEKPHDTANRTTIVLRKSQKGEAYDAVKEALARGEQAYIVCPLIGDTQVFQNDGADGEGYVYASISIEDDADYEAADSVTEATALANRLQSTVYCEYRVGLLHGRLPADEKSQVMDGFRAGDVQVLVSTTVIEVGVDVANATTMIIEDADRFGLSQLHQLRGRVGRGEIPGTVYLISSSTSEDAMKRLAAMETTEDGFELASYDLSLRREGDILGNRQSGASALKLVNVVSDAAIVQVANKEARRLIEADPYLEQPQNQALWREIRMMFRNAHVRQGG